MSLLIEGMDMPELGENADRLWVPGWLEIGKDSKTVFCTGTHFDPNTISSYAIDEIPTPHGRLIDADVIMDLLEKSVPKKNRGHQFYVFRHMLRNAPTVIEAEDGE